MKLLKVNERLRDCLASKQSNNYPNNYGNYEIKFKRLAKKINKSLDTEGSFWSLIITNSQATKEVGLSCEIVSGNCFNPGLNLEQG